LKKSTAENILIKFNQRVKVNLSVKRAGGGLGCGTSFDTFKAWLQRLIPAFHDLSLGYATIWAFSAAVPTPD